MPLRELEASLIQNDFSYLVPFNQTSSIIEVLMILQLLKNLKQVGLSHALSATMVVQGVAVQQVSVQQIENQYLLELAVEDNSQSQAEVVYEESDQYWEDIQKVADSPVELSEAITDLSALYENSERSPREEINNPQESTATAPVASTASLVAIASSNNPRQVSPKNNNASKAKPTTSSNGGQNNISSESVKRAIEEKVKRAVAQISSPAGFDFVVKAVVGGTDASANVLNEVDDIDEEEESPQSFEYVGDVRLFKDGLDEGIINEDDILTLDSNSEYTLVIDNATDFGSVNFNLENRDNQNIHRQQENELPFSLNGNTGRFKTPRAFSFEEASYQLDLTAYDQNGQGGEILETRTLRFSVTFD